MTGSDFGSAVPMSITSDFLGCSMHELSPIMLSAWVNEPALCAWMCLVVLSPVSRPVLNEPVSVVQYTLMTAVYMVPLHVL